MVLTPYCAAQRRAGPGAVPAAAPLNLVSLDAALVLTLNLTPTRYSALARSAAPGPRSCRAEACARRHGTRRAGVVPSDDAGRGLANLEGAVHESPDRCSRRSCRSDRGRFKLSRSGYDPGRSPRISRGAVPDSRQSTRSASFPRSACRGRRHLSARYRATSLANPRLPSSCTALSRFQFSQHSEQPRRGELDGYAVICGGPPGPARGGSYLLVRRPGRRRRVAGEMAEE